MSAAGTKATPGTNRLRFRASRSAGEVSALVTRPEDARWMLVLAHGAGAGMEHRFMEDLAAGLSAHGVASFRYQFPYTERGSKRPDPPALLEATVRAAVETASALPGSLPLLAGGKSMGGRMTSQAAAKEPLGDVRGIVFYGFPLHAIGKPGAERAAHLNDVGVPMLFLQGSRDRLADLELLEPVVRRLGNRASLQVVEEADHSFHVPARSGRTDADVLVELARRTAEWAAER